MSEELLEALKLFKDNNQQLETIKEEIARLSQDILEIKLENNINKEVREKIDLLLSEKENIPEMESLREDISKVSQDI